MFVFSSNSDLCPVGVSLRQGCAESPTVFVVFTDRILGCSRGEERLHFRHLKILPLVFPDDAALMAPSTLQHTIGRFTAECEAAGTRCGTSKCKAMVISRNLMNCLLQAGHESLLQVKEFRYLLFTSEGMKQLETEEPEQQV